MLVKTFTLRFDPRVDGFDDEAICTFTRGKEVLSVRDHFFLKDDIPYWSFLVSYNVLHREGEPLHGAGAGGSAGGASGGPDSAKQKYRDLLDEADWPLFNALRDWRAGRAKAEGVPPYIVLTNDVLAQVVKRKPRSLNELGQIPGFGPGKLKRYGRDLLNELGVKCPEPGPSHAEPSAALPAVPPTVPPPAPPVAAEREETHGDP